jgi:hypothetical protein
LPSELLAEGSDSAAAQPTQLAFSQGDFDYWTSKVRSPYDDFIAGVRPRALDMPQPEDSTFLFASSKGLVPAGLLTPDDIKDFPADGDMSVEVQVERFRPSQNEKATLTQLQSGTLRIDVKQVRPLEGLNEALAWTVMATLASRQKGQPIPDLGNVKFNPSTVWGEFQNIPLPGGLGFWSWNFFMKKRDGFWGQLLDHLFQTFELTQPMLPLLGIPGIAVSGLKYVDHIIGGIQAQGGSQWMFKGLDLAVCANRKSFDAAGAKGARKLPLTNGSYVIMPESKVDQLGGDWSIQDGLLVPAKTPPTQIYKVASEVLTDVSYMTISVSVTPSAKAAAASKAKAS